MTAIEWTDATWNPVTGVRGPIVELHTDDGDEYDGGHWTAWADEIELVA